MSIPVFGNERCVAPTVLKFIPPLKCVENWHRSRRIPYEVMLTVRLLNSTEMSDSSTSRTFQFEKGSQVSRPFTPANGIDHHSLTPACSAANLPTIGNLKSFC